jgi:hypothetical protein
MRKKITKLIESSLPPLYDENGDSINRRKLANKIYDAIPGAEKLELHPFGTWVPFACSTCHFNDSYKLGCIYELSSSKAKEDNKVPDNCPNGYR